jgi:hypothetical protein
VAQDVGHHHQVGQGDQPSAVLGFRAAFAAVGKMGGERVHPLEGDDHRHGGREMVRPEKTFLVPAAQGAFPAVEVGDGARILGQGLVDELACLFVHAVRCRSAGRVGETPALGLDDDDGAGHCDENVDVRVSRVRVGGAVVDVGLSEHRGQRAPDEFLAAVLALFVEALQQTRVIAAGVGGPVECLVNEVAGTCPQTAGGVQADDRTAAQCVRVAQGLERWLAAQRRGQCSDQAGHLLVRSIQLRGQHTGQVVLDGRGTERGHSCGERGRHLHTMFSVRGRGENGRGVLERSHDFAEPCSLPGVIDVRGLQCLVQRETEHRSGRVGQRSRDLLEDRTKLCGVALHPVEALLHLQHVQDTRLLVRSALAEDLGRMRQVLRPCVLAQQPIHVEQRLRVEIGAEPLKDLIRRHRGDQTSVELHHRAAAEHHVPGCDDRRMASNT